MSIVTADQESHAVNASLPAGTAMLMQRTDNSTAPGRQHVIHMCRRSSDEGRGSRKGPLEQGASPAAEAASGGRHPDPYMHEDPYMVSIQCSKILLKDGFWPL